MIGRESKFKLLLASRKEGGLAGGGGDGRGVSVCDGQEAGRAWEIPEQSGSGGCRCDNERRWTDQSASGKQQVQQQTSKQ